ncbi:LysM peptidoglycan-binding domain-containing protein [Methylothermus subterraneus]
MNKAILALPLATAVTLSGCSQQPIKPTHDFSSKPPALNVKLRDLESSPPSKLKKKPQLARRTDLWQRLFALYQLPEIDHPRIRAELKWYASNSDYLERVQKRARPYLYTIVKEIERNGLPGELALLPIVESAFEPTARSPKQAAGLWQFIPSTGEQYGLKQNQWVDLRHDVHASTRAAVRYLKKLHADFNGDWLLALAAYNAGEGRVMQEIVKNRLLLRPTDFWHLDLPEETKSYVPKLLAVARLFANAKRYGIALKPIPNRPLYARVDVGGQIDLALAARLADVPLEEIQRLNPGFRRGVTAPDGPHRLVLPLEKVDLFAERLAELPRSRWVGWRPLRETLVHVARNQSSSPKILKAAADRLENDRVRSRQAPWAQDRLASIRRNPNPTPAQEQRQLKIHVVRSGDTWWKVARRYGMEVRQLLHLNGLKTTSTLRVGQRLRVIAAPLRTAGIGNRADS